MDSSVAKGELAESKGVEKGTIFLGGQLCGGCC